MTLLRKTLLSLLLASLLIFSGCALSKMVKMAKDEQLTITPSPLEVHGDSVKFEMAALLPLKMLKKNKIYTVGSSYKYGDKTLDLGTVEFKAIDYPNAKTEQPKLVHVFSFGYKPEIGNGDLLVKGTASNATKSKNKSTEMMPVAKGLITTSRLVRDINYAAYAEHGYNNKEEYMPRIINFYFDQGSSVLKKSEMSGTHGKDLDAFIAKKNATKTVNIVGEHSPEGSETINSSLADQRAKAIEKYYKARMKHYNYKGKADSISFVTKGTVMDWSPLKKMLETTDLLNADQKAQVLNIVNGGGSFTDIEANIEKLPFYKKTLLGKVYPKLRIARTEILVIKPKKSDAELGLLSKGIADGTVKLDTLSEEELAYAATLTPLLKEKEGIYMALTKKNDSWSSHNNLGAVYLEMAKKEIDANQKFKLVDMAMDQLNIAVKKKENSAEVYTNMATAYSMKNMKTEAMLQLEKASTLEANDDVKKGMMAVKGVLEIKAGKYNDAVQSLSKAKETPDVLYDLALAQLLKKDFSAAKSGFDQVTALAPNDAMAFYGAGITAARMKDEGTMNSNLKKAVALDKSLTAKAMNDMEFEAYWNSATFKDAIR
jgi:tetratricopeptide (TPR) repeat protein